MTEVKCSICMIFVVPYKFSFLFFKSIFDLKIPFFAKSDDFFFAKTTKSRYILSQRQIRKKKSQILRQKRQKIRYITTLRPKTQMNNNAQ